MEKASEYLIHYYRDIVMKQYGTLSKTEHRPKEEQKPPDSLQGESQKHTGGRAFS